MKNRLNHLGLGVLALIAVGWLTGCVCTGPKSVCIDNEQRGFAAIICQPADVEVTDGQKAVFKVKAKGKDLTYQWFFKGMKNGMVEEGAVGAGTTGGLTRTLTVDHADPDSDCGHYWCEIESVGPLGIPVVTRTRDAHLGIRAEPAGGAGSGGGEVQTYPPQQASAPKPKIGSNSCGTHCSWVGYQNGGAGFDPDPVTTKGVAKVRIGTNFRLNSSYHLRWYDSLGGSGCAGDSSTDNLAKVFISDPNRVYFFTVYFISNCPSQGSQVYFELSFAP